MESMEEKVFRDLESVPYGDDSPALQQQYFRDAIHKGLNSSEFSRIVMALCKQLRILTGIQQEVSEMQSPASVNSFLMDVSSFLQELECPYGRLTAAPLPERLATPEDRLLLLDFLIGELQAARINYVKRGPEVPKSPQSPAAKSLAKICSILSVQIPADVDVAQLLNGLETKLQQYMNSLPQGSVPKPLLSTPLNEQQWQELEKFNDTMRNEYRLRREMLIKRFDVTIQSFSWSERAKAREAELKNIWMSRRQNMSVDSNVTMGDIVGATDDLLRIEKTTSHSVRQHTQCPINRVMIGNVPDRGGRPSEAVVPPRDMPGFKARVDGGGRGGFRGGRGGGHGGRGGRVQSGYGGGDNYGGGGHHGGRTFYGSGRGGNR